MSDSTPASESPYKTVLPKWYAYCKNVRKVGSPTTHLTSQMFNLSPDMTEYDMYKYLKDCNRLNDYKSVVGEEGQYRMYQMACGVWREDEGCNEIIKMIRNLLDNVKDLRTWLFDFMDKDKTLTAEEKEIVEAKFRPKKKSLTTCLCHMLEKKIGQARYPKNVLMIIKEQVCDNAWYKTINTDPMLLGFEDCVFHLGLGRKLKLHEISGYHHVFTMGNIGEDINMLDYKVYAPVTMSTKIELCELESYVNDPEHYQYKMNYEDFMFKVIPDKETHDWFLGSNAKDLDGTNSQQHFLIWTGSGANGKSVLCNLFKSCLGDYYVSVDSSLLLDSDKSANTAKPALATLKGKRFARFDEPDVDGKMKTGMIKKLCSGADEIQARQLYQKVESFFPQIIPNLLCNRIPDFKDAIGDGGFARRVKVVPFTSRFVENPTKPHEFKVDDTITQRSIDEKWHYFLLWDLLQRYKLGVPKAPSCVSEKSKEYLSTQDHLQKFVDEAIEKSDDTTDVITMADIKDKYGAWCASAEEQPLKSGELKTLLKLKLDGFTEKGVYVKSKNNTCRNVFVGYKFNMSNAMIQLLQAANEDEN